MGHIVSIGKDVETLKELSTLESFFRRQEWRTFAMQHLAEIVQREATVLGKRDPNAQQDDSMSDNYEDALNSAEFVVVNQHQNDAEDNTACDDDPWRQFNDFSPEEVVIETIPGMDSDDVETGNRGRSSLTKPKDEEIDDFEIDDPFDDKVEETEFKIEYAGGENKEGNLQESQGNGIKVEIENAAENIAENDKPQTSPQDDKLTISATFDDVEIVVQDPVNPSTEEDKGEKDQTDTTKSSTKEVSTDKQASNIHVEETDHFFKAEETKPELGSSE